MVLKVLHTVFWMIVILTDYLLVKRAKVFHKPRPCFSELPHPLVLVAIWGISKADFLKTSSFHLSQICLKRITLVPQNIFSEVPDTFLQNKAQWQDVPTGSHDII